MVGTETWGFAWQGRGGPQIRRRPIRALEKSQSIKVLLTHLKEGGSESLSKPIGMLETGEVRVSQ